MKCPKCRYDMLRFKHKEGGIFWWCMRCRYTMESTSVEEE